MRILEVTQAYFPFEERGGPAFKVRAIARALGDLGHHVTVLTADLGFGPREILAAKVVGDIQGWRTELDGAEVIYCRTRLHHRNLTVNPGVLTFCRRRLNEFDIVHIYGIYDLLGPAVAHHCRRLGIPYLVEPMGMFRPIVRSIRLKRFYHFLFGRKLLRGARVLVATSAQEQEELIAGGLPKEKIVIRRNGVSIPESLPAPGTFRRKWGIASAAQVVLFLGRISSKKAPDVLLRAFAAYCNRKEPQRPAILVIAGPDEDAAYRRQLESLVVQLKLSDRVLFTGPLYEDAKWAAFRDADIFVLPSQNENFGNTVAEAVACGTPVIVTDQCGVAPLVDLRAGVVVPFDGAALEEALALLLQDDALREKLRAGCSEVASRLSWHEPIEAMERLYLDILRENQGDQHLPLRQSGVISR